MSLLTGIHQDLETEASNPPSIKKPGTVNYWQDTETNAEGWVVFDKIINQVSGGGITMHENVTEQEVADIARNMSKKFTVTRPQIGGAKAGIRFNHRDPKANEVLRRFIKAHGWHLRNVWVTAGDLNTDDAFIESVIQKDLGLPTCQSFLGKEIAKQTGQEDLSHQLAKVILFPATPYFPMIEAGVGYVLAQSIREVILVTHPEKMGKFRVMIQGFGAVGSSLAYYLERDSIAVVVGIADKDCFVHSAEGIAVELLLQKRKQKSGDGLSTNDADVKKNLLPIFDDTLIASAKKSSNGVLECDLNGRKTLIHLRSEGQGDIEYLKQFLSSEEAEVFSPCAMRYQICLEVAKTIIDKMWCSAPQLSRYIVAGANNAFGIVSKSGQDGVLTLAEDRSGEVEGVLRRAGACILPDWVANSGTAQLFHRGLSEKFLVDNDKATIAQNILSACATPTLDFIRKALAMVGGNPLYLSLGCSRLSATLLESPIPISSSKQLLKPGQHLNPAKSRYALEPLPENKRLSHQERLDLCLSVGEECISTDELDKLLQNCPSPVAYDGFEPSGRMHIAQGVLKKINVDKMTRSGFTYIFWVADWFALMNHKMGGDLEKIKTVGRYFIEVWRACGMDMSRVRFLWASDEINAHHDEYMDTFLDIASKFNVSRIKRCNTIMGRKEEDDTLSASQIVYPCMQCTDIFFLGVDVCQLGVDQRKVNVLAREYVSKVASENSSGKPGSRPTPPAPVILSHHMLRGLKEGQDKMSKSEPDSAIFMEDSAAEVEVKIKKAFCPEKITQGNACIDYYTNLIIPSFKQVTIATRTESLTFTDVGSFLKSYEAGAIHPVDLKKSLTKYLNDLLQPVRDHFVTDSNARDLLEKVKQYRAEGEKK